MSRLTQPPILDGDAITAASLNNRFTQFSQAGTLNQFNTRDAAFDLGQFDTARFIMPKLDHTLIGRHSLNHASYNTVSGQTTGASPHVVSDATPTPTVLSFGLAGWTVTTLDVLRVYWDLTIRAYWESSRPWSAGSSAGTFTYDDGSGTDRHLWSGFGCWAFWLQWDVTDATLTNWTNVPGQGDFNTVVTGTRGGNLLSNCQATSVTPAALETGNDPASGTLPSGLPFATWDLGWSSVDGAWHVKPLTNVTVYGIRVVFSGPFAGFQDGSDNYLVRMDSIGADARLDYNAGGLQAVVQRTR